MLESLKSQDVGPGSSGEMHGASDRRRKFSRMTVG
jgi:hypothetical protein